MKNLHRILPLCVALLPLAAACSDAGAPGADGRPLTFAERVEAGRYLVHEVAMCADCHSPRNPDGSFDMARWLHGSPLGFQPSFEMPWAPVAPRIAGLPTMDDEQAIHFLMTGERPSAAPVLPPMPAYHLTRSDAESVVAYLKSLAG